VFTLKFILSGNFYSHICSQPYFYSRLKLSHMPSSKIRGHAYVDQLQLWQYYKTVQLMRQAAEHTRYHAKYVSLVITKHSEIPF
jgi:hypothetical protein